MSFVEPSRPEALLTRLALNGVLSGVYRRYVSRMGLRGDEQVLDFGSGSGAAAKHLAPLLLSGGGRLTCVDISRTWLETIRRTLGSYPNIEFKLGEISSIGLPADSYEVVLVHWMLHDVPAADRQRDVDELARVLVCGGRLFIREPIQSGHSGEGLDPAEIQSLMAAAGLTQRGSGLGRARMMGRYYSGVFEKPAAGAAEGRVRAQDQSQKVRA